MKRDMDLARAILLTVEKAESDPRGWADVQIENYDKKNIYYHIMLLDEAGLLEGQNLSCLGVDGFEWQAKRLTWWGHDFLDAARNDSIWLKAKDVAEKLSGTVSFDIMKEILLTVTRQTLGLAA